MTAITPDAYPKPYDCRQETLAVAVAESGHLLTVQTTTVARVIYGLGFKDTSGAANDITVRVYDAGDDLQATLTRRVSANEDKFMGVSVDLPLISLQPGWYITTQGTGNAELYVNFYDVR